MRTRIIGASIALLLCAPLTLVAQTIDPYQKGTSGTLMTPLGNTSLPTLPTVTAPSGAPAATQNTTAPTTNTTTATNSSCPNLTRNLSRGMKGTDVTSLQQFLVRQGLLTADSATGFFGALTEAAVKQWQSKNGVASSGNPSTTGYGAVGPKTRAAISRACTSGATTLSTTSTQSSGTSDVNSLLEKLKALQEQMKTLSQGNTSTAGTASSNTSSNTTSSTASTNTGANTTNTNTTTNTSATTASCSFNGQSVAHGSTVTAYQSSSVAAGSPCVSQVRSCSSGALSGTYTQSSCTMQSTYTFNGKMNANTSSTVNYTIAHEGVINRTGDYMVLKLLELNLNATPYGLGAAAIDVCLGIGPYDMNQIWTANGLETLCYSMYKSADTAQWPKSRVRYDFPGQGILVPPGQWVVVGSQGNTTIPHNYGATRKVLSDFSYSMVFAKAEANGTAPVQSLRMPYVDQSFGSSGTLSAQQFHANYAQAGQRSILGLVSYIGTMHYVNSPGSLTYNTVYMSSNIGSAGWQTKHQLLPYYGGDGIQGDTISPQNTRFNYGDATAVWCDVATGSAKNICAFYMFVTVPTIQGKLSPLPINSTIDSGQASVFCSTSSVTLMSDARLNDSTFCRNYLATPIQI